MSETIEHELSEAELATRLASLQAGSLEGTAGSSPVEEAPSPPAPTLSDVRAAVAAHRHEDIAHVVEQAVERYRYVRPFAQAADNLIDYLRNDEGRFMLGLREVDVMTRGFGKGELCYVTGFAHSGKTQLFLTGLVNNRHRNVVLFTLDEPAELVLAKLVGLRLGWNFEWVEERIKASDPDVVARVREVAATDFSKLVVVDESITLGQMADAMKEAEDYFGSPIDAVGLDYLTLLRDAEDVDGKSQALKRWTRDHDVPVIAVHQGGKGEAGKGQPITMTSMLFGGHAEAIFMLGCRRKRDWDELDDWERKQHENTVSVSVVKNKRPPSKRGETDFFLDPETGLIRPMAEGDLGTPLAGVRPRGAAMTAEEALAYKQRVERPARSWEQQEF